MEILHCSHLTKAYKNGDHTVMALDDVNLSLEKGSFTAIVGASGSGKSTLLHLLGGVDRPTSGSICIEGTDISTLNMEELAVFRRRKVGLIYRRTEYYRCRNFQKKKGGSDLSVLQPDPHTKRPEKYPAPGAAGQTETRRGTL